MVNLSSNEEGFFDLHTEWVLVPMVNPSSYGEGLVMETVCVRKAMAGRSCGRAVPKKPLVYNHCNLIRKARHLERLGLVGSWCALFWSYKVPQSTFDVKPKYLVTSNHDHFAPIRRTFSGVFACVATGDQPARAGPRVNRHPRRAQPRPPTAPSFSNAHTCLPLSAGTFSRALDYIQHGSTRRKRHKADDA